MDAPRDHGGGLDAARAQWGGHTWIDLSTGINPEPYPLPPLPAAAWTALPDRDATLALERAARGFWDVPDDAAVVAAPGASALIARVPGLTTPGRVDIPGPTYNEHGAAFRAHGWTIGPDNATARAIVHPNNPDGRLWHETAVEAPLCVIDESFCDTTPGLSLVHLATRPGTIVLKSFGKFWGLAGLRLGFAIGRPETLAPLEEALGPWPVSGPALAIGATALRDTCWAGETRANLLRAATRLDALMTPHGRLVGGTSLFRLYAVEDAAALQARLAEAAIWSRIFPYDPHWLRLGLPPGNAWHRLEAALA